MVPLDVPSRLAAVRVPAAAWVAALLALGLPGGASALDVRMDPTKYAVDFWQDSTGLPQNNVKVVLQGRDGYLWVGTKGGLARFDGARFTVYDDRQDGQLREPEVWALAEDRDGALWIGTFGGGLTSLKDGVFTTYGKKDGLGSDSITALCAAPDGSVWVGTDKDGVARLKDGVVERFTAKGHGIGSDRIRALRCAGPRVWVGTTSGLASIEAGKGRTHSLDIAGDVRVQSITGEADGSVWLGTVSHGLLRIDTGGAVVRYTTRDGLVSDAITAVYRDGSGAVWAGSSAGLCRMVAGRVACYYSQIQTLARRQTLQSVSLAYIQSIHMDGEGNLWVGTANEGLARLKDTEFLNYGSEDGLADDQTHTVVEAADGTLWVGTINGLSAYKDGRFTSFGLKEGLTDLYIRSLHADADGTVWVGTAQGLNVVRGRRIEPVTALGLNKKHVCAITRDRHGDLWIGTDGDGVARRSGEAWTLYGEADGLKGAQVRGLAADTAGNVWIGTKDAGLYRFRDGAFTTYTTQDGLPGDSVQSVYVSRTGGVWAMTRTGAAYIQDDAVTSFDVTDGLPANFLYQMVEDERGDLWITCGRGVFRIAKAAVDSLVGGAAAPIVPIGYGPETGLRSSAMSAGTQPTAFRAKDGRIWFTTLKGVSVIDPGRKRPRSGQLSVMIEDVHVDGRVVEHQESAEFPPGPGNIEIHYTALDLYAPDKVSFRYRLEGFDADWVDAGPRRHAYYTNVPPGAYRFHVVAQDSDGTSNETGEAFSLTIAPHFYQRKIFYVLVGAVALLGLRGVFALRDRRNARKTRELEEKVAERTAKLQEAIDEHKRTLARLERTNRDLEDFTAVASHDLQEPLRKIQAFADRLKVKAGQLSPEALDYLERVTNAAARMQVLIADLLTLSRVSTRARPFSKVDLGTAVKHAVSDLELRVEQTGARVQFDGLPTLDAEPVQMQQLFQNLIGNSLKFHRPDVPPVVTIRAVHKDEARPGGVWEVSVEDNGIGFDEQYAEQIFKVFQRLHTRNEYEGTGMGLAVCRKIVERHGGTIVAHGRPGEGATFVITLPAIQESVGERRSA